MYKLAFIGFGEMAGYHHSHLLQYDKIEAVGVYDIDRLRIKYARYLGLKSYLSLDELLDDKQIDIVLVATPNDTHKELCIAALKAGKHVLCEKPVTLSSLDLEEIIKTSEEMKKIFTVNQNRRENKDFLLMKKHVSNNDIGDLYIIESRVEGSKGIPNGWRAVKSKGGGMMMDWGVHLIDQLLYMHDKKVVNIFCKMYHINFSEVEDNFRLIMTFEDGLSAYIEVSTNNFITHPRWYVLGTKGTMQIKSWDCDGKIVRPLDTYEQYDKKISKSNAGPTVTMAPRDESSVESIDISIPSLEFDYQELCTVYKQMVNAIEFKEPLTITPHQCLRVIKVIEAAFLSAEKMETISTSI